MSKIVRKSLFPEFTVRGEGVATRIHMVQGLDLTLEQRRPDGEVAYLSHYSDPGTSTFLVLLKFLHISQSPIPKITKPEKDPVDVFDDSAAFFGRVIAMDAFPIRYGVQPEGIAPAVARINYHTGGDPVLEIESYRGTLTFSLDTARRSIIAIQKLYPTLGSFHLAYEEFLEEAAKHTDQIVSVKELRRNRPKQLQFPIIAELRRQEKEGKKRA
jgi:hypothetical protein